MIKQQREWLIPNRIADMESTALEIGAWAESIPLSQKVAFNLGLAVEEMLTNIIKYGYDDTAEHQIRVQVQLTELHVVLVLEDDGHEFDPLSMPVPDTTQPIMDRPIGGLGIHLVRRTCDQITYERRAGRNLLMVKYKLAE